MATNQLKTKVYDVCYNNDVYFLWDPCSFNAKTFIYSLLKILMTVPYFVSYFIKFLNFFHFCNWYRIAVIIRNCNARYNLRYNLMKGIASLLLFFFIVFLQQCKSIFIVFKDKEKKNCNYLNYLNYGFRNSQTTNIAMFFPPTKLTQAQ